MTSPDNTRIAAPSTLIDASGGIWSIRSDGMVLRNAIPTNLYATQLFLIVPSPRNSWIYAFSSKNGHWWQWIGTSNWKNIGVLPSLPGTKLGLPAVLTDSIGAVWSIRSDGMVLKNTVVTYRLAKALLWFGGFIYAQDFNIPNHWFKVAGISPVGVTWLDIGSTDPSISMTHKTT